MDINEKYIAEIVEKVLKDTRETETIKKQKKRLTIL